MNLRLRHSITQERARLAALDRLVSEQLRAIPDLHAKLLRLVDHVRQIELIGAMLREHGAASA